MEQNRTELSLSLSHVHHLSPSRMRGFKTDDEQRSIMYSVVGCGTCGALQVVEGEPETTGCPRCGKRLQFRKLRKFARTDDPDEARQARAELLADRSGHGEVFATLDSFAEMEEATETDLVDEVTYLEAGGIDPEEVAAAGSRSERGAGGSSGSRKDVVKSALVELDQPTESTVVEYAEERGVPAEYVHKALEKLVQAGEATENRGRYRVL